MVGADRRVISSKFGPKVEPGSGKDRDTEISVFRCLDAGLGEVIISQLLTAGMLPPLATRPVPLRASSWSSSLIMGEIAHLNGKKYFCSLFIELVGLRLHPLHPSKYLAEWIEEHN